MKKPSFKETITKTYKLIKEYKSSYILIVLFCLLAAIFNSIAPYFLGFATDSLYNSVKSKLPFNSDYIIKVLVIVLICYLINAVCTYFKSYLSSELGQKIGYDLRRKIISKVNRIKLSKLDLMKKGDIISKITNDVERLTDNITEIISAETEFTDEDKTKIPLLRDCINQILFCNYILRNGVNYKFLGNEFKVSLYHGSQTVIIIIKDNEIIYLDKRGMLIDDISEVLSEDEISHIKNAYQ